MSTFDEVIAAARADIAAFDQARDAVESTKSKAEQAHQQAQMLGAQSLAHGAMGLKHSAEEAQSLMGPAKDKLQELISAVNALKQYVPGEGGSSSSAVSMHPTSGDVDVGHLDTKAVIGDSIQPPQGGPNEPGSLRKELSSSDDRDDTRNRAQRFGRAFIRNSEGLKKQGEDAAQSGYGLVASRDPAGATGGATTESVGVPDRQATPDSGPSQAQVEAGVGNMVIMAAVLVEGTARWIRRRK